MNSNMAGQEEFANKNYIIIAAETTDAIVYTATNFMLVATKTNELYTS